MTDDEHAIRELFATWMKASETGDVNTVLNLMADDVIFTVPGRKPFSKHVFRAALEAMKDVRLTGTSDIREINVLGDWAYIHPQLHRGLPSCPPKVMLSGDRGYTLSILRKQSDGKWVLWRDANLVA
jgi:uncharacterized protein (TIGR02246 family)